MTAHHHALPFGVEIQADQSISFKVWSPVSTNVELFIAHQSGGVLTLTMEGDDGWWSVITDKATVGDRYGFKLDGRDPLPDPASRYQPDGVHALSQIIDPKSTAWDDGEWQRFPWWEAVIYQMHIGTFTPDGTYSAAIKKLPHLVDLGINAIELLPLAAFAGDHGWGYDGVLQYAPYAGYGTPEELKAFVNAAHKLGIGVIGDVVYNHFGPEGNYLPQYAPEIESKKYKTGWGQGFNYESQRNGRFMRDYIIHNSLYWLEEFRFDGLRFDAAHVIRDNSDKHVLAELAEAVHEQEGREQPAWLILENGENTATWYDREKTGHPKYYHAQWNDDFHHLLEVRGGGEQGGVYQDFIESNDALLAKTIAAGFCFQGEKSKHWDRPRGLPSGHLPPSAFVNFIENHDQVANRPYSQRKSERMPGDYLRVITELLLMMPTIPMLFMGQEWGAKTRFPFFCDFDEWLSSGVIRGRRHEVAHINGLTHRLTSQEVADPECPTTFYAAKLRWDEVGEADAKEWCALHKTLIKVRKQHLNPKLHATLSSGSCHTENGVFTAHWLLADESMWIIHTNLTEHDVTLSKVIEGKLVYCSESIVDKQHIDSLPRYSLVVSELKQSDIKEK